MHSATILAIGDSTTAGTPGFQSPLEAPPNGAGNVKSQFAYWLMRAQPQWRVINHGINGERSDQIRRRFERDVHDLPFDAVIVIAGVNDIYQNRPAHVVERELEAIFDLAARAARPIPVIAGSILPYNTATADQNARMHAVNQWLRDYAAGRSAVSFCDTRAAAADPDDPDRLASSPDGLHPGPEGYRLMAVALEPVVRNALQARPSRP